MIDCDALCTIGLDISGVACYIQGEAVWYGICPSLQHPLLNRQNRRSFSNLWHRASIVPTNLVKGLNSDTPQHSTTSQQCISGWRWLPTTDHPPVVRRPSPVIRCITHIPAPWHSGKRRLL